MNTPIKEKYEYKETKGVIISDNKKSADIAFQSIRTHREQLEAYVLHKPFFLNSLKPVKVNKGPIVVKKMAEASAKAGVGPMASVAGVIADLAVKDMIANGAKIAAIENGGEASAISCVPIDVALVAGSNKISKHFGFRLEKFPIGVATSSGKFSHALSFGYADAVTIFSNNAGLSDAAATAVGNVINGTDEEKAIRQGIEKAMSIEGVEGVFIIYNDKVGKAGEIPKIFGISDMG